MGHVLFEPHHWLMSRQFTYTYKLPTLPSSFLIPEERARVSLVYRQGEEGGRKREREREGGREGGREGEEWRERVRERRRERKEE